jgi:hypothetical protein
VPAPVAIITSSRREVMCIAAVIEQAKRVYANAGLDCGDGLLPPVDKAALDAMSARLGLPLPPELCEVYRVHGGQEVLV